jgi:anti-sigma B factor antagonist
MELSVDKRDKVAVVTVNGSVDSADSEALLDFIRAVIDAGQTQLVLDIADMDFIVSMGLGVFVRSHTRLRAAGGFLHLVGPQPFILQMIKATGLDRLLAIYDSVDQALE